MWPEAEKVEMRRGLVQETMSPEISEKKDTEHDDSVSENEDVGEQKLLHDHFPGAVKGSAITETVRIACGCENVRPKLGRW